MKSALDLYALAAHVREQPLIKGGIQPGKLADLVLVDVPRVGIDLAGQAIACRL